MGVFFTKILTVAICSASLTLTACSDRSGVSSDTQTPTGPAEISTEKLASDQNKLKPEEYIQEEISPDVFIFLPKKWIPATVPGSDSGFLITTSAGYKSLGFVKVSPENEEYENISDALFNETVTLLGETSTTTDISVVEIGDTNTIREISFTDSSGEECEAWLIVLNGSVILATLGPAYSDGNNGIISLNAPDEVSPDENVSGVGDVVQIGELPESSATEQVRYVLKKALGKN